VRCSTVCSCSLFGLRRMHAMLTIVTDVRSVCLSVCLHAAYIGSSAAVYAECRVRGSLL